MGEKDSARVELGCMARQVYKRFRFFMTINHKKLVIGCGLRPKEGAINLDMVPLKGVTAVHNLDNFPYPFDDEQFEYIEAEDVLEHVENLVSVMQELWTILKFGGKLWIRGPHASYPLQAWRDPTHKRLFVPGSFDMWDPSTADGKHYGHYVGKGKFKVLEEKEVNKGMEYTLQKI